VSVSDVRMEPLLRDTKLFMQTFKWLTFNHIFRDLDKKVDSLSKEDLTLPVGVLGLYEILDNEETKAMEFWFQI
jgi:hypothetical protein